MACLFQTEFSRVRPGNDFSLGEMDRNNYMEWYIKLDVPPDAAFNAVSRTTGVPIKVAEDTEVISGYGFGDR